jgi:hypothetical protein
MTKFSRFTMLSLAVVLLLVPAFGFAQTSRTTGALQGIVTDPSGAPLPGVTVTVTSPQLQGTRTAVSDANGEYTFPILPPGTYRAEYALQGIKTVVRENIQINLNQTTKLNVPMQMAVTETVTVTASQVVVDPTQTTQQQNFKEDHLKYASIGSANRSYQSVLAQAANVGGANGAAGPGGGGNPQVAGANNAQNNYILDGISTTDPVTHTFGNNMAFDAIQEISIQTLGKDAEYSSSGGTVNVITKSGGNNYSGSFDWRYNDKRLQSQGKQLKNVQTTASIPYFGAPASQQTLRFDKNLQPTKSNQPQATIGGPVMRDKLWFFAAVARALTAQTQPNTLGFQPGTREFKGWNNLAKVTFTPVSNQTLTALFIDSYASIPHAENSSLYSPEAGVTQTQGSRTYGLSYDSIITSKWLANAHIGHTPARLAVIPNSGNVVGLLNLNNSVRTGNYTNRQARTSYRDELLANTTYYIEAGGTHAVKGGLDYNRTNFDRLYNQAPGDPTTLANWDPTLCSPTFGFPAGNGCNGQLFLSGTTTILELYPNTAEYNVGSKQYAVFLQDEWNPVPRLTIKPGVRYEQVKWNPASGSPTPATFKMAQPRLGVAYDIFNNATSVVHGYAGKIMDDNQLTLPNYGVAQPSGAYDFCLNPTTNKWVDCGGQIFVTGNVYDPNLKPSYSNQYALGFTQKVWRNTSVDVTGEYRKQHNLFEDYCGHFDTKTNTYVSLDNCVLTNQPGFDVGAHDVLRSDYRGLTTKVESRPFNWFDLVASWTHSKSRGSTESTQNQAVAFDYYPIFFNNTYGYLSDDARNRVKLNGYFRMPLDFTLGVSSYWDDGLPWSVTQTSSTASATGYTYPAGYSGNTVFLEPRGSRRLPHFTQTDLQLQKDFRIGTMKFGLIGSVFNVFNKETPISIVGNAGSRAIVDPNTGQLFIGTGTVTLANGTVVPYQQGGVNRLANNFAQYSTFQRPRRYEAGVRFEF